MGRSKLGRCSERASARCRRFPRCRCRTSWRAIPAAGTRREWLECNGLGSFAIGHGRRPVDAPLPRHPVRGDAAAGRPHGARQSARGGRRRRRQPLRACRRASFPAPCIPRAIATSSASASIRGRRGRCASATRVHRAHAVHAARAADDGGDLAARRVGGRRGAGASVREADDLGARLPRAAPRERRRSRATSTTAKGWSTMRPYADVPAIYLHHNGLFRARARLVSPLRVSRRARARARLRRRSVHAGRAAARPACTTSRRWPIFSRRAARRGAAADGAAPRGARAARARCFGAAKPTSSGSCGSPPTSSSSGATSTARSSPAIPWFTDWGRDTFIALPGLALATGWTGAGARAPAGVGADGARRADPQSLPRRRRAPEYTCRRRAAVVRARGATASRRARSGARRGDDRRPWRACCRRCAPSSTATSTARGSASASTTTAWCTPRQRGLALTWMDAKRRRLGGDAARRASRSRCRRCGWRRSRRVAELFAADDDDYAHELGDRAAWARSSFAATLLGRGARLAVRRHRRAAPRRDAAAEPALRARAARDAARRRRAGRARAVGVRARAGDAGGAAHAGARRRLSRPLRTATSASATRAYHEGTVVAVPPRHLRRRLPRACAGAVPPGLLDGLRAHLAGDGLGQVAEIFDGDPPHEPRGCPAQAWSVAEMLRVLVAR